MEHGKKKIDKYSSVIRVIDLNPVHFTSPSLSGTVDVHNTLLAAATCGTCNSFSQLQDPLPVRKGD